MMSQYGGWVDIDTLYIERHEILSEIVGVERLGEQQTFNQEN